MKGPYDVIIAGGGPGGSTAGTFLARHGLRVLILERERFPRFHIGESLIPFGNDVLRETGVWPKLEAGGFTVKPGADFTLGNSLGTLRNWFCNNGSPGHEYTFQVERAKFDQLLLEHAAEAGAEVRQETAVRKVELLGAGDVAVTCASRGGEAAPAAVCARWFVDATGRDALLGKQLEIAKADIPLYKRVAIYSHFQGVYRDAGRGAGNITVVRIQDGWFWFIPLDPEKTSVGMVRRLDDLKSCGCAPEEWFKSTVASHAELRFRMKEAAAVSEFHVTGDYTYRYRRAAGERWLLVGDAAGFIDPIFSSGVTVALRSARLAAEAILKAERAGRGLTPGEQAEYGRRVCGMVDVFVDMIRMFYNNRAFEVFMSPAPFLNLPRSVNLLLSGQTEFTLVERLRVGLFYFLCWLQQYARIAPALRFDEFPSPPPADASEEKPAGAVAQGSGLP